MRSCNRRAPWRVCASPGTWTAASRRRTGCGPRAPTRCWPERARRACTVLWPFIHLDDAAAATGLALERNKAGIYNIVDDEPASVRERLPALANLLGAKPPRHFPRWLARLIAGKGALIMGAEARGASNAKTKRELGWMLRYPNWRDGFTAAYASTSARIE